MREEEIVGIVERRKGDQGGLIAILEDVQSKYSYLPKKALEIVAQHTGRSLVDIYGVATFYRTFSLAPRGKHLVSVCLGTACHVRGGQQIAEEFERQLEIRAGCTTADREFSLETVNCLGACALGPIVVIDGHYFSNVKTGGVKKILDKAREGLDKVEIETDKRIFPLEVSCPRCNHSFMDPNHPVDNYPSIRLTASFGQMHGGLSLSCLYGSYNIKSQLEIPENAVINFFCPHCYAELNGASKCTECEAPMVPMIIRGGGMLHICVRRGCKGHMLDVNGVNF